jgi:ubiquitin carboxyl-terminal hydrolase 14
MNATLQCLRRVPELTEALNSYNVPTQPSELLAHDNGTPQALTRDLKLLYLLMEKGQDIHLPARFFLHTLHAVVPEFAHKDEKTGMYQQQDAHECWSALVTNLSQTLKLAATPTSDGASGSGAGFMKKYFGVQLESTYKCEESTEEPVTMETEDSYQVSCFISQDVKYMHTALNKGLEGSVEKMSQLLGRNAVYKKTSRVCRLPAYLTVQFVRFFVGKAPDSEEMVPKKILKDVKYTMKLDMYEFCSSQLQQKLTPMRSKFKELEERKTALKAKMIAEGKLIGPKQAQAAAQAKREENVEYEPYEFEDDPGSNNSGYYDLVAVLTHQGRSSSSGHYVGWVALKSGDWVKLDDDKVSVVTEEQILKLSGGGDWHVAYILLYAPRRLERLREEEEESASEDTSKAAVPMETETPDTTNKQ